MPGMAPYYDQGMNPAALGGGGAAPGVGDVAYFSPGTQPLGYVPADGQRVYAKDYPGMKNVFPEFMENNTLEWEVVLGFTIAETTNNYGTNIIAGPDAFYVCCMTQVYRLSFDGSSITNTFSLAGVNSSAPIQTIDANDRYVFVCATGAVFRLDTQNLGAGFVNVLAGYANTNYVYSMACAGSTVMFFGNTGSGTFLYGSSDNGATWTANNYGSGIGINSYGPMQAFSCNGRLFFVGNANGNGLYVYEVLKASSSSNMSLAGSWYLGGFGSQPGAYRVTTANGRAFIQAYGSAWQTWMVTVAASAGGSVTSAAIYPSFGASNQAPQAFFYEPYTNTIMAGQGNVNVNPTLVRSRDGASSWVTASYPLDGGSSVRAIYGIAEKNGVWIAVTYTTINGNRPILRAKSDAAAPKFYNAPVIPFKAADRLDGKKAYLKAA